MRQETLTVVARVDSAEAAKSALAALGADRAAPAPRAMPAIFADPELQIHFARLVFVEGDRGSGFADQIVLESNFDTPEDDTEGARQRHVSELAARKAPELASVFSVCEGFHGADGASVAAYLGARLVPSTAAYQGHTHRSLARIRLEQAVREVVLSFLERAPKAPPRTLYEQIRRHVQREELTNPRLRGLGSNGPPPDLPDPATRSFALRHQTEAWIENVWPALPLVPRLPEIALWDLKDTEYDLRARQEAWASRDRERFREIAATEDHGIQNALTHLVPLRDGAGREAVLRHAHAYIDRMARNYFDDVGQLGGIPTIHFAKWLLLDGGRRLLFFSNYDGSWESYLGDFVDQAAIGLNLAWACTEGYPRTHLLAFGGAHDEERFKAWGRAQQLPTPVFYSAYPDLSIAAINNNTWIRHGLHAPGPKDLAAWFRRLS